MKIAVLYGGVSTERQVSLVTGLAVGTALADREHDVLLVDTAVGDSPVGVREARAAADLVGAPATPAFAPDSTARAVAGEAVTSADVVFIALHGATGENGTVQGLLECSGKPYTGSGVFASALAMDKRLSKLAFRAAGVPTPDWRVVVVKGGSGDARVATDGGAGAAGAGAETAAGDAWSRRDQGPSFPDDLPEEKAWSAVGDLGGYPVIVKPNDQGSTVGLTLVESEDGLADALRLAGRFGRNVLMERYVPGRELTVAVLDGDALPVVEVSPHKGLYDYESKYTKGMTDYSCPADIPEETAVARRANGLAAFAALGCSGYARVDYRLDPSGAFRCLEANTVPGMTEFSLVPMAARAAGIDFGDLCERIVETALRGGKAHL